MLSQDDLREIQAAADFGKRRMRFFMWASFIAIAICLAIMWALVSVGWVTPATTDYQPNGWMFLVPILTGGGIAELLKRWYAPHLLRQVAEEHGVSPESLQLALVDVSGS